MEKNTKELLEQVLIPENEQPYEVPENWCWTRMGTYIDYVTDYVANGSFASLKDNVKIYKSEEYALMVKTQDFANDFTNSLTYTDKHGYEFLVKSKLFGGELILCNIGSIGKIFRVPHFDRPMTLASNSIMIKCHNESDYDYLYYYFHSPIGYQQLLNISSGTAVLKYNKTGLKTIPIPFPPLEEQKRIVEQIEYLFTKLDNAKDIIEDVLESFNNIKNSVLLKAFTGELTSGWRISKNISIDDWNVVTLGDVVDGFKYGTSEKSDYKNIGIPVIRIPNIGDGVLDVSDLKYLVDNNHENKYSLQEGDILIIRSNGSRDLVGKSAMVTISETGYAYASYLIKMKPVKVLSQYLVKLMNSSMIRSQMFSKAKSSAGINNINTMELASLKFKLPSFEEQEKIIDILGNVLDKMERSNELMDTLNEIANIKKAILSKAFSGRLATTDLSEESSIESLKHIL